MNQERRKFERIRIPASAKVRAEDRHGRRLGEIRVLGRGGLLIQTRERYAVGDKLEVVIVDDREAIQRRVRATVRYHIPEGLGLEFDSLDADAAVEIGVIIGKYYSAAVKK